MPSSRRLFPFLHPPMTLRSGSRALAPKRAGSASRGTGAIATCAALLLGFVPAHAGQAGQGPRSLLVRVRDTAPGATPNFLRERDGSYTVSTGQGGDRDLRAGAAAADNSTLLSTSSSVRVLRVREGEPVRVDLPQVQTLQFHVPTGKSTAPSQSARASGAARALTPSAAGVVFFEAVASFSARFALMGDSVRIELVPMQAGGVAAPFAVAGGAESVRAVTLVGRAGEWIALGDSDLVTSGQSLSVTAELPSQPTVWVRVDPDAAERH